MVTPRTQTALVVGAGIGGLAAAALLAARGLAVTVLDRAAAPGGKLREEEVGSGGNVRRLDAGPTVFTMRWVFEELFAEAGSALSDHLVLEPAAVLARHAWDADGGRLDLHADPDRAADAIGAFAGAAEARGYREFCARARRAYRTLEGSFIRAANPSPVSLALSAGPLGMLDLWAASPFATLWDALGSHFGDPRLRQLFGRYATYCGASPFQASATLMLVAHVEQEGVWLVEGGMHRLAAALAGLAARHGAVVRTGTEVVEIRVRGGRAAGVRLADGEELAADAVVVNADPAAVAGGLLGAAAAPAVPRQAARSLSAVTWAMLAEPQGFPLLRHTVFFSADYRAEFDALFGRGRLPLSPTVYVCAQDRGAGEGEGDAGDGGTTGQGEERLLCLVNAPAVGDDPSSLPAPEIEACETAAFGLMRRCGLTVRRRPDATVRTTPAEWARLYPGTGGALYGAPPHGWAASFSKPGARTALPGLYLAGGGAHPGAGVPMAAMSGRLAAARVLADLGRPSRKPAARLPTAPWAGQR